MIFHGIEILKLFYYPIHKPHNFAEITDGTKI